MSSREELLLQCVVYRGDPKASLWIFGGGDGREDRGVAGCPFGFRRSTPGLSLYCKEIPYSGHAIKKEAESRKRRNPLKTAR